MIVPEFSRPIQVATLQPGVTKLDLAAEPEERAALARRFGLIELSALTASINIRPEANGLRIVVDGTFDATVMQQCVITLEPIENNITSSFHCVFSAAALQEDEPDLELAWDEDDPDEPIIDGTIDMGEVVAERLGLEIDPFPKSGGAEFEGYHADGGTQDKESSASRPFSKLQTLLTKKN